MALWSGVILCSAVIFGLSSRPGGADAPWSFPGIDKVFHIAAYAVWASIFGAALWRSFPRLTGWQFALLVVAGTGFYGLSDELHQMFVPGRVADGWDVLADLGGSVLFLLLLKARRQARKID